ncbi:EscU/YscU/HrcU family type III secretion system export apparatus switch protein [bacterium]|nr:EscU/YscU/HrcU family type III secretion system export apparatus switch protein [bacterium]MCP5463121.1 EscU/YscU/HrcU family type III secretion system export apparatus switch protein [bacterium]
MPDQYKEDKTERATPKRLSEARSKGNVASSQEIMLVVVVFGTVLSLYWIGPFMRDQIFCVFKSTINHMNYPFNESDSIAFVADTIVMQLKILMPILIVIVLLSYFSNWVQFGSIFTFETLKPKLSNLKPKFSELNIFKKDKVVKLITSLGKLLIIAPVAYVTVKDDLINIVMLVDRTIPESFNYICLTVFKVVSRIMLVMLALAIGDFVYRKWKYSEDMKMTKQEVKDERKNMDQDPMIKSKIRSYGREIMRKLMYKEIPKADVVITNPTHIAVAIRFDPVTMAAPIVVAKGARLIAEKIKDIARAHNVPIVENKPLARLLFKTVDVGMAIPPELYRAVAEVLAYIYRMNKKKLPKAAV